MEDFRKDFLASCSTFTNCKIICSDGFLRTHKLILAASGDFIRSLLEDISECEDVTLMMVDFKVADIENHLDDSIFKVIRPLLITEETREIYNVFKSKPPEPINNKKEKKNSLKHNQRESPAFISQWDSSHDDDDSHDANYDSEIDSKFIVKMEQEDREEKESKRSRKKFLTPMKSSYPARSHVNIEELSKQIIPNPLTPAQAKKNEWIEKQIRHEKAVVAYLGGEESMREISMKYDVKKSTLSRLLQCDRTIDRTGRRTSIFTTEEETAIANKARAWVAEGGSLTINMLRDMMYEEIRTLKLIHPDRQFCSLSSKDGEAIHRSYVRRFVIRNDLERLLFRKFTLLDKRKFECDICSKSFTLKCSLVTHQKQIHYSFLNKIPT